MYQILLDSSNTSLTVGVAKDFSLLEFVSYEAWQQQSEYMIPELQKLMEKYHIDIDDVDAVLVAIGPGSYTGVRISLTIAKTIAATSDIKIYTFSSLQILKDDDKPSICLINARSNRSYIGVYQNEKVIIQDTIYTNEQVNEFIANHPEYSICGDTKYLGIAGKIPSLCAQMLSLIPYMKPIKDPLGIKPAYLK
ncbi:MAG: tRNA (adenosine(37)-N6)-threonylcarbamoyltransferase complex dimerization subunit type 1 TsaB [Bacilli bacterium]|nr:tRNA (adenosine(37)-N6)-threonylcarbamoyltransferase complex dimerization subunit type 1 TsaB [Bacilli bacterium]